MRKKQLGALLGFVNRVRRIGMGIESQGARAVGRGASGWRYDAERRNERERASGAGGPEESSE